MTREPASGAPAWRACLACAGIALALGLWRVEQLALCGAAGLACVLARRSSRRALWRRLRALTPVLCALALAAVWSAAAEGGGWSWAGAGSQRFVLIGLRVLVAALYLTLLTHDLSASALEAGLQRLGLPESFVSLLIGTRRFGQQLTATLEAAWAAGVLRGGLLSLRALSETIGSVAGVVLVRSLDRSESIATASALRAGGSRPEP